MTYIYFTELTSVGLVVRNLLKVLGSKLYCYYCKKNYISLKNL